MKLLGKYLIKCNINGLELHVPEGCNFLTIDCFGNVKMWLSKPYLVNGCWVHDTEMGIIFCCVSREETDVWLRIFDVKSNVFLDPHAYMV